VSFFDGGTGILPVRIDPAGRMPAPPNEKHVAAGRVSD